jgi:hypothetical protein
MNATPQSTQIKKKNKQNHQHSEGPKFIQKKKKEKMPNDNQNLKPL